MAIGAEEQPKEARERLGDISHLPAHSPSLVVCLGRPAHLLEVLRTRVPHPVELQGRTRRLGLRAQSPVWEVFLPRLVTCHRRRWTCGVAFGAGVAVPTEPCTMYATTSSNQGPMQRLRSVLVGAVGPSYSLKGWCDVASESSVLVPFLVALSCFVGLLWINLSLLLPVQPCAGGAGYGVVVVKLLALRIWRRG